MTMDQIAMWCGYTVMVGTSVFLAALVVWLLIDAYEDFMHQAARAARESYWFVRWKRFERIAKARKNRSAA